MVVTDQVYEELQAEDAGQRFAACRALSMSIWAAGLLGCRTPSERLRWQHEYARELAALAAAWAMPPGWRPGVTP